MIMSVKTFVIKMFSQCNSLWIWALLTKLMRCLILNCLRVWRSENWHKGGCNAPQTLIHYIRPWEIPMFDELWSEIQDAPGEIFDMDIPELKDEKFDVNEYLNANYDY